MNNDRSADLFELNGIISRGYSSLITNAGKVVAVITLIIAGLVTFTDVALTDFGSQRFTTTLIVMLASSYLMYFSLLDTGEREGEECEVYKRASERYTAIRSRISPDMMEELRGFCLSYSLKELEYRRMSYLGERGYSTAELERYKSGEKFPKRASRIFRRAESMKAVRLTPSTLMTRSHGGGGSELQGPGKRKLYSALMSLIPSTLCMIFTLSVILTAKDGLTVSTVIDGLVKLSALPMIGIRGLLDGFRFAKEDKAGWLETKARLLESFIGQN